MVGGTEGVVLKVLKGNIWLWYNKGSNIVISTNGFVKKNGECVMGRGIAFQAAQEFSWLPRRIGEYICKGGNHVFYMGENLISFPVKHNWWERADLNLIDRSAKELEALVGHLEIKSPVILPKVGCHNGRLDWKDVEPILDRYLNNERFMVVDFE